MRTLAALLLFAVAPLAAAADRYLVVQPIQVATADGSSVAAMDLFPTETNKILAQAGIEVVVLAPVMVFSDDYFVIPDGATFDALVASGLGQHPDSTVLNIYFVGELAGPTSWGLADDGGNCLAISGTYAVLPTTTFPNGHVSVIAHEAGHCMGLGHCCGDANPGGCPTGLMGKYSCSSKPLAASDIWPDGAGLSTLTQAQINTMLQSPLVQHVWTDLGMEKWGATYQPTLSGTGVMLPGAPLQLALQGAPNSPGAIAILVVGLSQLNSPFDGGTLVPFPNQLLSFGVPPSGSITLSGPFPGGLGGASLYFQYWLFAGGNSVATNGVRGDVPTIVP